jgi:GDP-mannose 6-dehydrogenase
MMKISIFGLGYVGAVTAACLANDGHEITGVDPNGNKVDIINSGRSPIIEKDLEPMIANAVKDGRLKAVTESRGAILGSDISIVCVGTPSKGNGSLDLKYVENVVREIGEVLKGKDSYHIVVIRSTVLPGTTEDVVIPELERTSTKKEGIDFGVAFNPEFLRESTSVYDFYNPPKTVIGSHREEDVDSVSLLYKKIEAPLVKTSLRVAEMVKYVDNTFHALKVTFGNEIGNLCKAMQIDSHEVMDIFCLDTKLNLSPYYLKPGFAFGGSCLPKDLNAISYKAQSLDLRVPLIQSIHFSNEQQIKNAVKRVMAFGKKRIGVLGFAFKAGTDDLRESPIVELIETLLGKGYSIKVYDSNVNLAKVFGANKEFIETRIPHIAELMVKDLSEIIDHSEVIVIGNKSTEFKDILNKVHDEQHVFDLVRISPGLKTKDNYEGISW